MFVNMCCSLSLMALCEGYSVCVATFLLICTFMSINSHTVILYLGTLVFSMQILLSFLLADKAIKYNFARGVFKQVGINLVKTWGGIIVCQQHHCRSLNTLPLAAGEAGVV